MPSEEEPLLVAAAASEIPSVMAASIANTQPSFIGFAMTAVSKRRKKSSEPVDSGQLLLFAA
jgi:hypothetical protein